MSDKMITVKMPLGDYENVADLHNGAAVGAARDVLYNEIENFSRIIGFIDEALGVSGDRTMNADLTAKLREAGALSKEEQR